MEKTTIIPFLWIVFFLMAIQCGNKVSETKQLHERAENIPADWSGMSDYSENYNIK
jgi:hypothetical protein